MFEDLIFAAKAILKGYKIAYVPEAKVWHSHNFSLIPAISTDTRTLAYLYEIMPGFLNMQRPIGKGLNSCKQEIAYLSSKSPLSMDSLCHSRICIQVCRILAWLAWY